MLLLQVPLGLSEAFATAMLAADKAFADHTAAVTPTTAASTFIEGLQAAVANCTSGLQTNLQPRSAGWYKWVSESLPECLRSGQCERHDLCRSAHDTRSRFWVSSNPPCSVERERAHCKLFASHS